MMYRAKIKRTCPVCKGKGYEVILKEIATDKDTVVPKILNCKRCNGTGKIIEEIEILELNPSDEK